MPNIYRADSNTSGKSKSQVETSKKKKRSRKKLKVLTHKRHPKYKYGLFASFMYYPRKVNFINKDPEEQIILILRRHFITNVSWISIAILMSLFPLLFIFFPVLDFMPHEFQIITILGWYMMVIAYVFENFLSWFFGVNIITDERVFDVDFINLVNRDITDANIDQIQDVSTSMIGAIRTLFNYGDVFIQTAAQVPKIEFVAIPNPDRVARILRELRVEEEIEKLEGRVR